MTKLVIVHPGIYTPTNEALSGSFASDVKAIRYSQGMTKEDILGAVEGSVSHIAFLYHYPGYGRLPFFEDSLKVPDISNYTYFSNTLIDIIKALRDRNSGGEQCIVDILTCDLNAASFKEEVAKIKGDLGIEIRYSVDKTGNPASGANWVLESNGVNVQTVYFTEGILAWNGVLSSNIADDIKAGGIYSSYITWNAGTATYTVQRNFLWSELGLSDADSYIYLGAGETFDGNGKTIDITGYNLWQGLFSSGGVPGLRMTVQNLGILNGEVANDGGFIMRQFTNYIQIQNCYSTGSIGMFGGGIVGSNCGNCSITNCFSTGRIGIYSGGIVGSYSRACSIMKCFSTGDIGNYGGGIAAAYTAYYGSCEISECYSTGNTIYLYNAAHQGGGICGYNVARYYNCTITDCYSTGNIVDMFAGSIIGNRLSTNFICTLMNCYSLGTLPSGGGLVGGSSAGSVGVGFDNVHPAITDLISCPTDLSTIDNTLYSGWLSSVWVTGGDITVGGTIYKLPILKTFQQLPWSASAYTIPTSVAQFYISSDPIGPIGPIGPITYTYIILADGTASISTESGISGSIQYTSSSHTISGVAVGASVKWLNIGDI